MKISRTWAMPNKWTFTIKPIKELLKQYVGNGKGWVDPFAGKYSPAEITNDLNPGMPSSFHLRANDFLDQLPKNDDPCGENGEFHSFVFDGPIFKFEIPFSKGDVVLRENRFYFCDLIPK